jgi:hypothetical protein
MGPFVPFASNSWQHALVLAACALALPGCDQGSPTTATAPADASLAAGGSPRAAIVIRNAGCGLIDGAGGFVFADRDVTIATQSTRQNTTLICKVKNVSNPTGHAVRYDSENTGVECGTFRGSTTDWNETVSASGNATLRCHFRL